MKAMAGLETELTGRMCAIYWRRKSQEEFVNKLVVPALTTAMYPETEKAAICERLLAYISEVFVMETNTLYHEFVQQSSQAREETD